MPPIACINVAFLTLQLLFQHHPSWHQKFAAVVSEGDNHSTVLAVNRRAYVAGVRVGMHYTTALSIAPYLHTDTVSQERIKVGIQLIEKQLLSVSPNIEWSGTNWTEPGAFWLEVEGLKYCYPSAKLLIHAIQHQLKEYQLFATVVLGYTRLGTFLLARELVTQITGNKQHYWKVIPDADSEQRLVQRIPLKHLPLKLSTQNLLGKLGIATVADFLTLSYFELLNRFGSSVAEFHRIAHNSYRTPLQSPNLVPKFIQHNRLLYCETNVERIKHHFEELLNRLLKQLIQNEHAVVEIELQFLLENGSHLSELIQPTFPTRSQQQLMRLIALRLNTLKLSDRVEELSLNANCSPLPKSQIELFQNSQKRDLVAGSLALANIRAEFGNTSVAHAIIKESHLPETQFQWQSTEKITIPRPHLVETTTTSLVRRILTSPMEIPDLKIENIYCGPFFISSGWWLHKNIYEKKLPALKKNSRRKKIDQQKESFIQNMNGPVDREYYFSGAFNGAIEWHYYDRLTGSWYLQGWIE